MHSLALILTYRVNRPVNGDALWAKKTAGQEGAIFIDLNQLISDLKVLEQQSNSLSGCHNAGDNPASFLVNDLLYLIQVELKMPQEIIDHVFQCDISVI